MRLLQAALGLYQAWSRVAPRVRGRGAILRTVDALQRVGVAPPVVTSDDGVRLELGTDYVVRDVLFHGRWEPEETALLASLTPPGGVFVDVGANVGYFTLLASRWVGEAGRVYAFEPARATHERLRRNVRLNGAANVSLYQLGCAAAEGSARLDPENDPGHAHLVSDGGGTRGDGAVEAIELTTLDAFAEREKLRRLDVIKIDVEGADFEVLRGARAVLARFRPTVLLEVELLERFGSRPDDVAAFLAPLAYDCEVVRHRSATDMLCRPRAGR